MARFRKKPVVIDAAQWNGTDFGPDMPDWLQRALADDGVRRFIKLEGDKCLISTLEGLMTAAPGWWIIRGIKGELYPCDPEIFAATYKPVGRPRHSAPGRRRK
jgi:hypothetical protein